MIIKVLYKMKNINNPLLNLSNEIRIWLQTIRYETSEPKQFDYRTIDMIATLEFGILKQRVLVRCIEGEITQSDVRELNKLLDRKTPQGWLICDKLISNEAREIAAKDEAFKVFTLPEFLREMVWGSYFDTLEAMVEKGKGSIRQMYVDLGCFKHMVDASGNITNREIYPSLDNYVDNWLNERGKMHISLLGEFGTGKTWFCRHYAYRQLERYLINPINERLPLLITLRDYTKATTVQQLINDALLEQYKLPFFGSAFEVFQEMNRRGKLLLILDGFDEMARQVDYQTVVDNFWELANLVTEKSKVILTSRTEYFHWAKESEKILGGEEFGRRTILLSPPKFEVLYLEPFNNDQIRQIITLRLGLKDGASVAERILDKSNLAEMSRKPVLIELLLAALDEVSTNVLENPTKVYLYATNKLLLRNIDTKRTFTTTADKLYFLCELAWEMIKSGELRIHYTSIPERIKTYFGQRIKDQHELDTWDFDLRNQTLLHRNAAGYYEFAHKSLAEYFVAFKFAAELGCLSQDFVQTYYEADGKCCQILIKQKHIDELANTFGAMALTDERMHAVRNLLHEMIAKDSAKRLWEAINETKGKKSEQVKYAGGNAATLLWMMRESFVSKNLANTNLAGANLLNADLTNADLRSAYMVEINLRGCNLTKTNMEGCDLRKGNLVDAILLNANMRNANLTDVLMDDPIVNELDWSLDDQKLVVNTNVDIRFWNLNTWQLVDTLQTRGGMEYPLALNTKMDLIVSTSNFTGPIIVWDIQKREQMRLLMTNERQINNLYISPSGKYVSASHGESGHISIWDIATGKQLASFEAQRGWCNAAVFLQDEETVLSTGYGGDIKIWNWRQQKLISKFVIKDAGNVFQLKLNRTYDRIAAIVTFPDKPNDFGKASIRKVFVWTFPDFRPLFSSDLKKYQIHLDRISLSPENSRIAVAGVKFIEDEFDVEEYMEEEVDVEEYMEEEVAIEDIKIGSLSSLILYNIDSDAKTILLVNNQPQRFDTLQFSTDGRLLACGGGSIIYIWDTDIDSINFGQCIQILDVKMNCQGVLISGASGIEQEIEIETIRKKHKQKVSLLEFFAERGAVLDDMQKQILSEA